MATRALPVGLLLLTLVLDEQGLHRASFYVLVFALAAAAVAALTSFGDVVEGAAPARLEAVFGGMSVLLVLAAAAARGQTPETVPPVATSATLLALLLLGLALLRTAAPTLRRALAR